MLALGGLVALVALAACSSPPTHDLVLPSGHTVALQGVGPVVGPLGMVDRTRARDTVFLVQYIADSEAARQTQNREELLTWAGPQAAQAGVRYVALSWRAYPYGRLVPRFRGGMTFYERDSTGRWVRYVKDTRPTS